MHAWLLLSLIIHQTYSIKIGLISNVSVTVIPPSVSNIRQGTKEQCLCAMVSSPNITALNYFSNNTCQLFSNQSIINNSFIYNINLNSSFYFLQLPVATESSSDTVGRHKTVIHC